MKRTTISLILLAVLAVSTVLPLIASQSQAKLEIRIENILLKHHGFEVGEIEALGPKPEIRQTLLRMVAKYRNAASDTEKSLDIILLDGAVFALGEMKEERALQLLSDLLADRTIDNNIRGRTARALGNIDAEASKEVLLQSLDPARPDYITVRMAAIRALGKTRDGAVVAALQRYLKTEKDDHLRQSAIASIRAIRSKIQ